MGFKKDITWQTSEKTDQINTQKHKLGAKALFGTKNDPSTHNGKKHQETVQKFEAWLDSLTSEQFKAVFKSRSLIYKKRRGFGGCISQSAYTRSKDEFDFLIEQRKNKPQVPDTFTMEQLMEQEKKLRKISTLGKHFQKYAQNPDGLVDMGELRECLEIHGLSDKIAMFFAEMDAS